MLKRLSQIFICCTGLLAANPIAAQPPPPPPPGPLSGTDVPFDTQSIILLASTALFGVYKMSRIKK